MTPSGFKNNLWGRCNVVAKKNPVMRDGANQAISDSAQIRPPAMIQDAVDMNDARTK